MQGNGTPLSSAQVRVDGTTFTATTAANGTFTLTGVPAGSGYLLKVSAAGFASKSLPGIIVTAGTTDVGTIQLGTAGGPYRLIPLQPDVNPPVTQVEAGGIGYRYYRLVPANGKDSPGGVAVSLRVAGGSTIPQDGGSLDDWTGFKSDYWAGFQAGTADGDGMVRLRIPASALGGPGARATLEALESGVVKATFSAQVVPRQYDQVWRQKVGYGAGGKVVLLAGEASVAYETEVRHTLSQGTTIKESIARTRTAKLQGGVEFSGGLEVGPVNIGGGIGGVAFLQGDLGETYRFNPTSTDPGENAMKLYVALGDTLLAVSGPAKQFLTYAADHYEQAYMSGNLDSAQGGVRLGASQYGNADLLFGLGNYLEVGAKADVSVDTAGLAGVERHYLTEQSTVRYLGLALSASGAASTKVSFGQGDKDNALNVALFNFGQTTELRGKLVLDPANATARRVEVEQTVGLQDSTPAPAGTVWQLYGYTGAQANQVQEYTETVTDSSASSGALARLAGLEPLWGALARGDVGPVIHASSRSGLMGSVLQSAANDGRVVDYERTVYAGTQRVLNPKIDLDAVVAGLSVSLEGNLERGAEVVNERGRIWQHKCMALESYPAVADANFPASSVLDLEKGWAANAFQPIAQALNQFSTTVAAGAQTVIQAGKDAGHAVLQFGQGVMSTGSQVITKYVLNPFGLGSKTVSANDEPVNGPRPNDVSLGNLNYGIGGIYRFESTNSFDGTGTLTISYTAGDVSGLNPADLRIYYLPDGTNRWQLVGGTVNVASNTVTAVVSQLGTYAIAPPLPTGDLKLVSSTNALSADGVSQMTITVTNLMLNNGGVATQQWVFTATALGVNILTPDLDPTTPGVQVASTNGAVTLLLGAPQGGYVARVSLASVVGDASGTTAINLTDNTPPATPSGVSIAAGQSRIWAAWQTNKEPDMAGYRVYYRLGQSGPPWDGTAAVEGMASPVQVVGTNFLLRGLLLGTNYFVAVSAVDTTGNESALSTPLQVTTTQAPPAPPTAVAARFGLDGTNILMWALSEDDGYNDRDVVRYDVFRAVLPGGSYVKVGEASAGVGFYTGTNMTVGSTQYVRYAVTAVATNGVSSPQTLANRLMADGVTVDNDGDGIPDWWMVQYFGHPTGQASDQSFAWSDPAGDGLSTLQKYLLGSSPLVWDNLHFTGCQYLADGRLKLGLFGQVGHNSTLLASTNLVNWAPILSFACTNSVMDVFDSDAKSASSRFYRLALPAVVLGLKLGLGSAHPLGSNGLDLVLFSLPGLEYRIDASSNLVDWTTVTNILSTNATMHLRDSSATNYSRRFYRAVVP